jgi:NAD(P)H dehydrogenase (quinone)
MVVTAHPVETSYNAAIHAAAIAAPKESGHEVDHCDLYAEGFDPVLSRAARLDYHDPARNRRGVGGSCSASLPGASALRRS